MPRFVLLNSQTTEKDTNAYMEHLMDNLMLRLMTEHEVIHQDGTVEKKGSSDAKAASAS